MLNLGKKRIILIISLFFLIFPLLVNATPDGPPAAPISDQNRQGGQISAPLENNSGAEESVISTATLLEQMEDSLTRTEAAIDIEEPFASPLEIEFARALLQSQRLLLAERLDEVTAPLQTFISHTQNASGPQGQLLGLQAKERLLFLYTDLARIYQLKKINAQDFETRVQSSLKAKEFIRRSQALFSELLHDQPMQQMTAHLETEEDYVLSPLQLHQGEEEQNQDINRPILIESFPILSVPERCFERNDVGNEHFENIVYQHIFRQIHQRMYQQAKENGELEQAFSSVATLLRTSTLPCGAKLALILDFYTALRAEAHNFYTRHFRAERQEAITILEEVTEEILRGFAPQDDSVGAQDDRDNNAQEDRGSTEDDRTARSFPEEMSLPFEIAIFKATTAFGEFREELSLGRYNQRNIGYALEAFLENLSAIKEKFGNSLELRSLSSLLLFHESDPLVVRLIQDSEFNNVWEKIEQTRRDPSLYKQLAVGLLRDIYFETLPLEKRRDLLSPFTPEERERLQSLRQSHLQQFQQIAISIGVASTLIFSENLEEEQPVEADIRKEILQVAHNLRGLGEIFEREIYTTNSSDPDYQERMREREIIRLEEQWYNVAKKIYEFQYPNGIDPNDPLYIESGYDLLSPTRPGIVFPLPLDQEYAQAKQNAETRREQNTDAIQEEQNRRFYLRTAAETGVTVTAAGAAGTAVALLGGGAVVGGPIGVGAVGLFLVGWAVFEGVHFSGEYAMDRYMQNVTHDGRRLGWGLYSDMPQDELSIGEAFSHRYIDNPWSAPTSLAMFGYFHVSSRAVQRLFANPSFRQGWRTIMTRFILQEGAGLGTFLLPTLILRDPDSDPHFTQLKEDCLRTAIVYAGLRLGGFPQALAQRRITESQALVAVLARIQGRADFEQTFGNAVRLRLEQPANPRYRAYTDVSENGEITVVIPEGAEPQVWRKEAIRILQIFGLGYEQANLELQNRAEQRDGQAVRETLTLGARELGRIRQEALAGHREALIRFIGIQFQGEYLQKAYLRALHQLPNEADYLRRKREVTALVMEIREASSEQLSAIAARIRENLVLPSSQEEDLNELLRQGRSDWGAESTDENGAEPQPRPIDPKARAYALEQLRGDRPLIARMSEIASTRGVLDYLRPEIERRPEERELRRILRDTFRINDQEIDEILTLRMLQDIRLSMRLYPELREELTVLDQFLLRTLQLNPRLTQAWFTKRFRGLNVPETDAEVAINPVVVNHSGRANGGGSPSVQAMAAELALTHDLVNLIRYTYNGTEYLLHRTGELCFLQNTPEGQRFFVVTPDNQLLYKSDRTPLIICGDMSPFFLKTREGLLILNERVAGLADLDELYSSPNSIYGMRLLEYTPYRTFRVERIEEGENPVVIGEEYPNGRGNTFVPLTINEGTEFVRFPLEFPANTPRGERLQIQNEALRRQELDQTPPNQIIPSPTLRHLNREDIQNARVESWVGALLENFTTNNDGFSVDYPPHHSPTDYNCLVIDRVTTNGNARQLLQRELRYVREDGTVWRYEIHNYLGDNLFAIRVISEHGDMVVVQETISTDQVRVLFVHHIGNAPIYPYPDSVDLDLPTVRDSNRFVIAEDQIQPYDIRETLELYHRSRRLLPELPFLDWARSAFGQ